MKTRVSSMILGLSLALGAQAVLASEMTVQSEIQKRVARLRAENHVSEEDANSITYMYPQVNGVMIRFESGLWGLGSAGQFCTLLGHGEVLAYNHGSFVDPSGVLSYQEAVNNPTFNRALERFDMGSAVLHLTQNNSEPVMDRGGILHNPDERFIAIRCQKN